MNTCETLTIENIDEDTLIGLVDIYVGRMSPCCRAQCDAYQSQARDNGMSAVEACKHGLYMAVINEMVIESVVEMCDKVEAEQAKKKPKSKKK